MSRFEIDLDPASAVGIGWSTQPAPLLAVLEREAELSTDPMRALDFRYRIGELY